MDNIPSAYALFNFANLDKYMIRELAVFELLPKVFSTRHLTIINATAGHFSPYLAQRFINEFLCLRGCRKVTFLRNLLVGGAKLGGLILPCHHQPSLMTIGQTVLRVLP